MSQLTRFVPTVLSVATCALLVGCAPDQGDAMDPMDPMEPLEPAELVDLADVNLACAWSVSLDGWNGATPTATEFPALGVDGATICLTLDSTLNIQGAHFAANSDRGAGSVSLVEMALFDEDERLVQEGWDVTFGQTNPQTFANLEYGMPVGSVVHAKLFVRSLAVGTVSTRLELSFFEPLE